MKLLPLITMSIFFTVACSGSGGFTDGFKLGKKSEKKDTDNSGAEGLGKETNSSDSDSADQPVQITGTYLTCSETASSDTRATFGCHLARKKNGKTVNLNEVGSDWSFDYEILNSLAGSVTMKKASSDSVHQIFYEFEAAGRAALKALIKGTRISLSIDLLPGIGVETNGPEFNDLIVNFVPVGQSELINGAQAELNENVINAEAVTSDSPQAQTQNSNQNNEVVNPLPTTAKPPVVKPDTPAKDPTDSESNSEKIVPAAQIATEEKPTQTVVVPGPQVSDKDPVVTFSLEVKSPGIFALKAAFDQSTGLSDATFSGGTAKLGFVGALIGSNGSATLGLTTPVSVSVKKGSKTCTGSDTIGAGKISLPLVCK